MAAEDLLVHDGRDGQAVEAVGESLPQLDVEPAFTCGINGGSESGGLRAKDQVRLISYNVQEFTTHEFTGHH